VGYDTSRNARSPARTAGSPRCDQPAGFLSRVRSTCPPPAQSRPTAVSRSKGVWSWRPESVAERAANRAANQARRFSNQLSNRCALQGVRTRPAWQTTTNRGPDWLEPSALCVRNSWAPHAGQRPGANRSRHPDRQLAASASGTPSPFRVSQRPDGAPAARGVPGWCAGPEGEITLPMPSAPLSLQQLA